MPANRLPRKRKNTVKAHLTLTPAGWLLAEYDMASRSHVDGPLCVQPIYTLKSVYQSGESMRVTASDYGDKGRWWL